MSHFSVVPLNSFTGDTVYYSRQTLLYYNCAMLKTRVEQTKDAVTPLVGAVIMVLSIGCFIAFLEAILAIVRFAIG